jgi:hypothetical protein
MIYAPGFDSFPLEGAVTAASGADWSGVGWNDWKNLSLIRAKLDAGADANSGGWMHWRPLDAAAEHGSPEVVAELAGRVDDVDAEHEGRTALWRAVYSNNREAALALERAGADPLRPMMSDWSPARLSLAGPLFDLFENSTGNPGLSAAEDAAVAEAGRLITTLGDFDYYGMSLACVAGISASEAARRLNATLLEADGSGEVIEDPWSDEAVYVMGATDVPGGCVVSQPWAYGASMPGVTALLAADTTCYAMYANPKSGNQGSILRNGSAEGWDLHPGGGEPSEDDPADEILRCYLYQGHAMAYCCAYANLQLTDARAITGSPDIWMELPHRDYWT